MTLCATEGYLCGIFQRRILRLLGWWKPAIDVAVNEQRVLTGGWVATLAASAPGSCPYGLIEDASLALDGSHIAWVGPRGEQPRGYADWAQQELDERLVTPGLIDCHTHLVYGGHRAREFEQRLEGASYEEISRAGGGIRSTVAATREALPGELQASALSRLDCLLAEGLTTLEVKSGYGLDLESERKMLEVARSLAEERSLSVVTTFLGAHALPEEFAGRPDAYVDHVCTEMLPALAKEGLVDAVDGFCEGIAFSVEQMRRVFESARQLGLPVKLHAEQLSALGGAQLVAEFGGLSADHLEYASVADAQLMAKAGTVAVLLPGAFYTLRETRLPPIDSFRAHGVPIAIATDSNPGSSPLTSLLMTLNLACTLFRLTPAEALAGVTRNAARALGLEDRGVIAAGKRADLAIWEVEHPSELAYRMGYNPLWSTLVGGQER